MRRTQTLVAFGGECPTGFDIDIQPTLPVEYYQRIRTFLATHKDGGPPTPVTWRDIGAVIKSFWEMGVVHRGRRAYWSLLASTLLRHPSHFGVVITLVITGHHFRQVSRGL